MSWWYCKKSLTQRCHYGRDQESQTYCCSYWIRWNGSLFQVCSRNRRQEKDRNILHKLEGSSSFCASWRKSWSPYPDHDCDELQMDSHVYEGDHQLLGSPFLHGLYWRLELHAQSLGYEMGLYKDYPEQFLGIMLKTSSELPGWWLTQESMKWDGQKIK